MLIMNKGLHFSADDAATGGDTTPTGQDAQPTGQDAQPTGEVRKPPAEIMPDATAEELRKAVRELRDENEERRKTNDSLVSKIGEIEGTTDDRLNQIMGLLKDSQDAAKRAEFASMAVQAGMDRSTAELLDMSKFDLSDPDATIEKLKGFATSKPLPDAGTHINPDTSKDGALTVNELVNLSPEEWEKRLPEILAMKPDKAYTG